MDWRDILVYIDFLVQIPIARITETAAGAVERAAAAVREKASVATGGFAGAIREGLAAVAPFTEAEMTAGVSSHRALPLLRFTRFFGFCEQVFFLQVIVAIIAYLILVSVECFHIFASYMGLVVVPGIPFAFLRNYELWRFINAVEPNRLPTRFTPGFSARFQHCVLDVQNLARGYGIVFVLMRLAFGIWARYHYLVILFEVISWGYCMSVSTIACGLIFIAIEKCSYEISEFRQLLIRNDDASIPPRETETDPYKYKLRRFRELSQTLSRLGSDLSPYFVGQFLLVAISAAAAISYGFEVLYGQGMGALLYFDHYFFLAFLQILLFWTFLMKLQSLNSHATELSRVADDLYTDAGLEEGFDDEAISKRLKGKFDAFKSEKARVKLEKCKLLTDYIKGNICVVGIYGRRVDVGLIDIILGIHLTLSVYVGGPLISSLLGTSASSTPPLPAPSPSPSPAPPSRRTN